MGMFALLLYEANKLMLYSTSLSALLLKLIIYLKPLLLVCRSSATLSKSVTCTNRRMLVARTWEERHSEPVVERQLDQGTE
jgi:hypothetical protein